MSTDAEQEQEQAKQAKQVKQAKQTEQTNPVCQRPSKIDYYLMLARAVAARGTCLRRRVGAVIVRDDAIVSTGYVGAPRGAKNCIDIGLCPREKAGIPSGERYELCRSVHAEANAVINAARNGGCVLGGTLYLWGESVKDGSIAVKPCRMCRRVIINAGIAEVIFKTQNGYERIDPRQWIENEEIDFTKPEAVGGY